MGYAVSVDGDQLTAAAADLTRLSGELEAVGEAVARALSLAAQAAGGGALTGAAQEASQRWRSGLVQMAAHGHLLARATGEAAEAYLAVERHQVGVWTVGERTGWRP